MTAVNSEKVSINAANVGTIVIEDNDVYDGIAKDDIVVTTTYYKSDANNFRRLHGCDQGGGC